MKKITIKIDEHREIRIDELEDGDISAHWSTTGGDTDSNTGGIFSYMLDDEKEDKKLSELNRRLKELKGKWETKVLDEGANHASYILNNSIDHKQAAYLTYYDAGNAFDVCLSIDVRARMYEVASEKAKELYKNYCKSVPAFTPETKNLSWGGIPGYMIHVQSHDDGEFLEHLAYHAMYARPDTNDEAPTYGTRILDRSREAALACLLYQKVSISFTGERLRVLSNIVLSHLKRTLFEGVGVIETFNPFILAISIRASIYGNFYNINRIENFCDAIIGHYESKHPQRVPYEIVPDGMRSRNAGDPHDEEYTTDLNMMIAPVFAFAWKETGDIKYKEFAYELWLRAYENASLYIPKVFNQNLWWYEDFIKWMEIEG